MHVYIYIYIYAWQEHRRRVSLCFGWGPTKCVPIVPCILQSVFKYSLEVVAARQSKCMVRRTNEVCAKASLFNYRVKRIHVYTYVYVIWAYSFNSNLQASDICAGYRTTAHVALIVLFARYHRTLTYRQSTKQCILSCLQKALHYIYMFARVICYLSYYVGDNTIGKRWQLCSRAPSMQIRNIHCERVPWNFQSPIRCKLWSML